MITRFAALITRLLIALPFVLLAQPAQAQATFTYINNTAGNVNGTTICTAPLVRTFNVPETFTVADVDFGFFGTHTWRGDFRITLRAPDGTAVQLVTGDATATSGDNLNVLLDDDNAQVVNTDPLTGNHSAVMPPPFQNDFSPNAPLANFNGVAANGTWTMEVCDIFPGADNGVFRYAELRLSPVITPLSVTKISSIISDPVNGSSSPKAIPGALVEYLFSVNNPNTFAVENIIVSDFFPADLKMCLADIGGQGPVAHTGFPGAGPTYSFVNLNNDTDDFDVTTSPSAGPIDWTYNPVLDGDQCDTAITGFRVTPNGSLNASGTITLRARFILE